MFVDVLGISCSPKIGQTTDQLIYEILRATHLKHEFISLANKKIHDCKSCSKCNEDDACVIHDDWVNIDNHIDNSFVLVIGAPNNFNKMNNVAQTFLERFNASHKSKQNAIKLKFGIIAAVAGDNPDRVEKDIKFFYEKAGIEHVGTIKAFGDSSCHICKHASKCNVGVMVQKYAKGIRVSTNMIPCLERQPEVIKQIKAIGNLIHNKIVEAKKRCFAV